LVIKFIEEFQGTFDEVTSRLIIDDVQSMILLLATLPTSYRPFISTHGHDTTLISLIIVVRLLQEEALTKPQHENGTLTFFVNNKENSIITKGLASIIFTKVEQMLPHVNPRLKTIGQWWNVTIATRKKHFASK
jgi:hypothetical protein